MYRTQLPRPSDESRLARSIEKLCLRRSDSPRRAKPSSRLAPHVHKVARPEKLSPARAATLPADQRPRGTGRRRKSPLARPPQSLALEGPGNGSGERHQQHQQHHVRRRMSAPHGGELGDHGDGRHQNFVDVRRSLDLARLLGAKPGVLVPIFEKYVQGARENRPASLCSSSLGGEPERESGDVSADVAAAAAAAAAAAPEDAFYVCHFLYLNPEAHAGCLAHGNFRNASDALAHHATHHLLPHYCPVCLAIFPTPARQRAHILKRRCEKRDFIQFHGISEEQRFLLSVVDPRATGPEQWRLAWQILFGSRVPCPTRGELEAFRRDLALVEDFWHAQGRDEVNTLLAAALRSGETPSIGSADSEAFQALGNDVVARLLIRLKPNYLDWTRA
ncbi:unnamed protein product [Parascedosporium putredinis]|uniref:Uncharacterized protein n=1 Tax=Parascedosporium putredinis TaxID=1442378 RepID=A0A9P1ME98_9PEZI|nr:unnamed protein product [Parascedosporium putredinis]CAI8000056.1 unnamed protein product [Parascedosporium putredinis]